ncbi:Protein AIM7 [Yarrowia sp. B02]|nr:Protein AIM7 [Yarrowia sp. B02]
MSLYTFPDSTLKELNKFRFASARVDKPQAMILEINKNDYSIQIADTDDDYPFSSAEEIVENLPDNTPRYIVLSHPIDKPDGRKSSVLAMIYYRPATSTQEARMLYAGAVELVRGKAGVSKFIEIDDEEEFENLADLVQE